jgi:hypothetical protein
VGRRRRPVERDVSAPLAGTILIIPSQTGYNPARLPLAPPTEDRMPVETPSLFSKIIQDHLDLQRRNAGLESEMPIERYKTEDPFDNHPLFKTEEQARLEETLDGLESPIFAHAADDFAWQTEMSAAQPAPEEDTLWTRSRDFDWGD